VKGPFSKRSPLRELQPGPPLNLQKRIQSGVWRRIWGIFLPDDNLICSSRIRAGKEPIGQYQQGSAQVEWVRLTKRIAPESHWPLRRQVSIQRMILPRRTAQV